MLSKTQVKFVTSLHLKKNRTDSGLFIAEGTKVVGELLASRMEVVKIFATSSFLRAYDVEKTDAEIYQVNGDELKKITTLTTPNEVLAVVKTPVYSSIPKRKDTFAFALDAIRDPGNLGTIIRIADWYGISEIYCSNDCVDAYSPKVIQTSMGSFIRVKIYYGKLDEILKKSGRKIYAATLDGGKNIYTLNGVERDAVILIGNESKGVSAELVLLADAQIKIPQQGRAESLNASVAAAIIADNFTRLVQG